jgi:hypothetical protein
MRRMLFASLGVVSTLVLLAACAPAPERTAYVAPGTAVVNVPTPGTVVTGPPPTGVVVTNTPPVVVASVAPVNGRCPAGMSYSTRTGYCIRY